MQYAAVVAVISFIGYIIAGFVHIWWVVLGISLILLLLTLTVIKKSHLPKKRRQKQVRKIQVPYIDQSIKYPTGCESVSAVMLLKYLGYEITVDEFIQNCLECREMEIRDGVLYGRIRINFLWKSL
mgnify:FL=1